MGSTEVLETIGISSERLHRAYAFLQRAVDDEEIPGAALAVSRHGTLVPPRAFGRLRPDDDAPPMAEDTIFLVASVTKPVTVAGLMLLVARGLLALDDPVYGILPKFRGHGKKRVQVRHLMTHTSGLPDMLPDNTALREEHEPLSEFARHVYDVSLDFRPGTDIQYQSMGILMLATIAERLTGMAFPDFLQREVFGPLGMHDTSLGIGHLDRGRVAHIRLDAAMRDADWGWNSAYWWELGAPWGGMFSTVSDIWRFQQLFLNGGRLAGVHLLSPAATEMMTRDQTSLMPALPRYSRRSQAWGLGWRRWPFGSTYFGDLLSPQAFGHGGATGTVVWADPERDMTCALFTTEPSANSARLLGRCSTLVAAAAL